VAAALTNLESIWPLALTLVAVGLLRLGLDRWQGGMHEVDELANSNFELKLASLFQDLGYDVKLVATGRGDLVVEKDGRRAVVQAKAWPAKNTGVAAVNKAAGARGFYGADEAIVVTTRSFKAPARKQAARKQVELWDRERLTEALQTRAAETRAQDPS